jgi:hypothetical protein
MPATMHSNAWRSPLMSLNLLFFDPCCQYNFNDAKSPPDSSCEGTGKNKPTIFSFQKKLYLNQACSELSVHLSIGNPVFPYQ